MSEVKWGQKVFVFLLVVSFTEKGDHGKCSIILRTAYLSDNFKDNIGDCGLCDA